MSPWTRWPLTARGTGAALLAALCFVLAHQFGIPELLYLSLLLALGVGASIATLYFVRSTERVSRAFSPDIATVGQEVLDTLTAAQAVIKIVDEELTALMAAWQAGGLTSEELFDRMKAGGIIRDDMTYGEHEAALLDSEPGPTRDPAPEAV